jgi:hypothetical protein
MSDLADRLRNERAGQRAKGLFNEAADEIEQFREACIQLRDERDKLRAELQLIRCTVNGAIKRCGIEDPK